MEYVTLEIILDSLVMIRKINHREHRGHRELLFFSVLSVPSVVF